MKVRVLFVDDLREAIRAAEVSAGGRLASLRELLESGVPKELARLVLPPLDTRRILWSINLRQVIHVLCFRLYANSQEETKQLMEMLLMELDKHLPGLRQWLPYVCCAWEARACDIEEG